jgi:hypothetical protein
MNLKVSLLMGAVLAWSLAGRAQFTMTVEPTSFGGPNFVDHAGVAVPDGNAVKIGYFDDAFNVAANANDLNALKTAFHEFGTTPILTANAPSFQPGAIGIEVSGPSTGFEGRKIYLWGFKTAGAALPDASFSNVSDYGLFSSTFDNWKFPTSAALPGVSIFTSEVDQYFHSMLVGGAPGSLELAAVPEPQIYAMATALLLLGFGAFRHAHQRKSSVNTDY